jgi:NTE family protein
MLFHLGALWRLNQLGYLAKLDRVSSVSGGSITAAALARRWGELSFDADQVATNFHETVVPDVRALAGKTIDVWAILRGTLWFGSIGNRLAGSYGRHLFKQGETLQDLPDRPRFIFNATNLQSGVLWRFGKLYMADYKVGKVDRPTVPLAVVVAASSAFTPFLSPLKLKLANGSVGMFENGPPPLHMRPYTKRAILSDGGVYDNLGLEAAKGSCEILLVSDGGGTLKPRRRPWRTWPLQALRVLKVIDSQVRALRARDLIDDFDLRREAGKPAGTLWAIRTPIAEFRLPDSIPVAPDHGRELANIKTRLKKLPTESQERLVNLGYALCDAAMRTYVAKDKPAPTSMPYPDRGI